MVFKQHGRTYDLVVFGANGLLTIFPPNVEGMPDSQTRAGYTGKYTAEHITAHLPTDLKWAIAGRSREKLQKVADELKQSNPDRRQPGGCFLLS